MHKNGHFLKRINGAKSLKQQKKEQAAAEIDDLKSTYRNVDKELSLIRKLKADKIKRFHANRN